MRIAMKGAALASALAVSLVMTQAAESQSLKTGHYSVSPAAVTPGRDTTKYQKYTAQLENQTSTAECFSVGINLPHRATITNFVVWYKGGSMQPLSVQLVRSKLDEEMHNEIAYGVLADKSALRKRQALVVAAANALVDNSRYTYGINLCMWPDGARFYGARVTYTYTP